MVTKNNYYTIRHWGLDIVSASHPSGTAYKRKLPSQAVTTQKFKINSELGVSAHAQYPERNELITSLQHQVSMSLPISLTANLDLLSSSIDISQNMAWNIVSARAQAHLVSYMTFSTHILSLQDMTSLYCISKALWIEVVWYIYIYVHPSSM